jgi:hypothetical protein
MDQGHPYTPKVLSTRTLIVLTCALLPLTAAPLQAQGILPTSPQALLSDLNGAWRDRSPERYLALWRFPDEAARNEETQFARERMTAEEVRPTLRLVPSGGGSRVLLQLFTVREPRGRLEEWGFDLTEKDGVWAVTRREALSSVTGLAHLNLHPQAYRADGRRLVLEDFELTMDKGTLFTTPSELGPTAITFVGEGRVRFVPRPEAERQQLRLWSGRPELSERVRTAFIRIHPSDFDRLMPGGPLQPDPQGAGRLEAARRFHSAQAAKLWVLDARLPRSPWTLMPPLGDAAVIFTVPQGTLTFSVFRGEAEAISLADREKRRQICLYPAAGRDTDYDEDDGRAYDVVHHQLNVRVSPGSRTLKAVDEITLDVHTASTLQLNLADSLRVESVTSEQGGEHLFFRVRHQDSLMVSLGMLAGRTGRIRLRVQYSGTRGTDELDREVMQTVTETPTDAGLVIEEVLVYTNRASWYPQVGTDDYATVDLTVDVPDDYVAVSGGRSVLQPAAAGRRVFRYVQDRPAKYTSLAVGRFVEAGSVTAAGVEVQTWAVRRSRSSAARITAQAAGILDFLTAEFGPSPYPSLNMVVMEGRTPGGHSPPGMIVLSERPSILRGRLEPDPASFQDVPGFFLAHELAHQWWGHGVAGQNYRERWLSEGMAQYAAALWTRQEHGEREFRSVLRQFARWARFSQDAGPIHLGQRLGHVRNDSKAYRAVVYNKGAYVLHMLRSRVGEPAFRMAVQGLQATHRFQKIGTRDLQRALETAGGTALGPYFEAWIYGTRLPELSLRHRSVRAPEGHRTEVDVVARDLPGPLKVLLSLQDGESRDYPVEVSPGSSRHTFVTAEPPRRVELNRDLAVLATVR